MHDRWFFRAADAEGGPLTFAELQALVRKGELGPDEHVCKQGQAWIPVRRVEGLIATAITVRVPEAERRPTAPSPLPRSPVRPFADRVRVSHQNPVPDRRWPRVVLALLPLLVGVVLSARWFLTRPQTFPPPVSTPLAESSPERLAARAIAMRAPIPRVPSIPGLRAGVPTLLSGLEQFETAFSPALSADLRIIVFGGMGHPDTGYDLYLADRASPADAFSPPRLIASCATAECEAYPALSPDGLELPFARSDFEPVLMSTRRESRNAEFSDATVWTCPEMNDDGLRIGYPQFVDADRVAFARSAADPSSRRILLCERPASGSAFGPAEPILMVDAAPPYFVAANRLRAYYGFNQGLAFTVRSQWEVPFGIPLPLTSSALTGPVDGPIWVCPKEDVIFYCSAGPGKELGSSRKLWMLRY